MNSIPHYVVDKVISIFKHSYPSGIVLQWEADRFLPQITSLANECTIQNDTDFNYSFCNSYSIFTKKKLINEMLCLKISFIVDCFWFSFWRKKNRSDSFFYEDICALRNDHLIKSLGEIRRYLLGEGFFEVFAEDLNLKIPSIKLELAENPTLENCLFDDY